MNTYIKQASQFIDPINIDKLSKGGTVYELVNLLSIRANQINTMLKEDLNKYTDSLYTYQDSLSYASEVDLEERIRISKKYEEMPKPLSISIKELQNEAIELKYREGE